MKVAFRIDISSSIGTGHKVRMSALASAMKSLGCCCSFFTYDDEPINYSFFQIVVVDTYLISSGYISRLKKSGPLVVCYDDNALYTYDCHILINANFHAFELGFRFAGNRPVMMLGPEYALLRDEFAQTEPIIIREQASEIFMCFGGSDIRDFTPVAIRELMNVCDCRIHAVLGAHTSCDNETLGLICDTVRVYKNPDRITDIMASCDIAVTGAGSMVYELACFGLPSILVTQADNQELIAEHLDRKGLMKHAGSWKDSCGSLVHEAELLLKDHQRRKRESTHLSQAVNKHGAMAAAKKILETAIDYTCETKQHKIDKFLPHKPADYEL